ncbi:hypothetical protein C7B67_16380 [filamentous cyanobacterium Phorm 6]|nr:hypothetical protein C7B67_16380 [filamentous cyanobacterium Phorm 6]
MKHLKRIAEIRKQIESLKFEAEAIEPDAILEAFDILEANQSPNGKSLVFSDTNAKIVLVLRNRYDDKNTSVVRLNEDIDREYEKLCRSNATAIENNKAYIQEIQEMIEAAEAKHQTFLVSVYLETLRKQRSIALKKTEHKVPSLAVYLK